MIEAAAQMYCRPEINFEVQKWIILGKTVLEVDIPKLEKRPCLARDDGEKWLAYLRVEDQNLLANRVLMKVWLKEKRKKGILLEYSEAEEKLLDYLKSNENITISKYCRMARLHLHQAEEILSNLIVLDVIDIRISEKEALYSLIPER